MMTHIPQPDRLKRIISVTLALIILCTASWLSYTVSHIYAASEKANTASNVNSLLFGENLILDDQAARSGSPLSDTSDQFASQAYRTSLQQLHVGVIRIPARSSDDQGTTRGIANAQAVIDSSIDTLQMNATPLIILRGAADPQMLLDNGPFMDQLMTAIDNTSTGKNATVYVEFGNEPNIHGISAQEYVTDWNLLLSMLKAKTYANQLKFVGPVINQFDSGSDGSEAYMQAFLNGLTPTTLPDAISWHEYPCTSTPNITSCNAKIDTNWQNHVALYRQLEKQSIIPNPLPIWITEYNYSSSASANDSDTQFQQQWTSQAIQAFAQYGVTAAFHYDVGQQEDLADSNGNLMAEGLGMQDAYGALAAESTPTPTVTSTPTITATSTPTSTPTPTVTPTPNPGSIQFSFEDGTLDGWTKSGNVTKLANSNDVPAEDGSREIEVDFSSRNSTDDPYISVGTSHGPLAGQTLTAYVYIQSSVSVSISAKLFVQDTGGNWHMPNNVIVSTGSWTKLTYIVPTLSGTTNRIGIQLYGDPNNVSAKIYVDAVSWA